MHRARDLLVRQRTQLINAFRGHAAEFGVIGAQGRWNVTRLLAVIREGQAVPEPARTIVEMLAAQLDAIGDRIEEIDARILAWHKANPSVSVWRGSPGSALSSPPPSPPPWLTRRRFETLASLPRGLVSPLDKNPPAASSGWDASAGKVTSTSGGC